MRKLLPLLLFFTNPLLAQTTPLALDEAVGLAIQQNYGIQLQRLATETAASEVYPEAAGKGFRVSAVGSAEYANNFSEVVIRTFAPPPAPEEVTISEAGVQNVVAQAGIRLDYVLYDGGRADARYALLEGQLALAKAEQRVVIGETALGVAQLYLELAKLQNQAAFLRETIEVGTARIAKLEDRRQFGKANGLDILQAQIGRASCRERFAPCRSRWSPYH